MKLQYYILIAIVLIFAGLYTCERIDHKKEVKGLEQDLTECQTYLDSLKAAKSKVTIRYDTVTKLVTKFVTKPRPVDSAAIYEIWSGKQVGDFAWGDYDTATIWQRLYIDTLKTEDFSLPYRLSLWGDLEYLRFDKYDLFTKETIKEHIVNVPVVEKVDRSHLYMYMMFGTTDFDGLSGLDLGLNFNHRKGWGLMGGWQLHRKESIWKAGVTIRLL